MLNYVLRHLAGSVVALFVMSLLAFSGVHAIGKPVDLLINPQADQAEIDRATALLGLTPHPAIPSNQRQSTP
jgi:peptide/nickel transport system permease protein